MSSEETATNAPLPKVALFTVFIARENILFLREWLEYYRLLGISSFVLYDNSKVQVPNPLGRYNKSFQPGKTNKHGIPYAKMVKISDAEVEANLREIVASVPGACVVPWEPRDGAGRVMYAQEQALNDAKASVAGSADWLLCCDMDEYLVLPGAKPSIPHLCRNLENAGYPVAYATIIQMANRWRFPTEPVLGNELELVPEETSGRWQGKKYLIKPSEVRSLAPHLARGGRKRWLDEREAYFLHFNVAQRRDDAWMYRDRPKDENLARLAESAVSNSGIHATPSWKASLLADLESIPMNLKPAGRKN